MIEDTGSKWIARTERFNGKLRTWWHYNWLTLVIAVSAVLTLSTILAMERAERRAKEQTIPLSCWPTRAETGSRT